MEAIKRFWKLYEGKSVLISDDQVDEAAGAASVCISNLQKRKCEDFEMEAQLAVLATAMQHSLLESWKLDLSKYSQSTGKRARH